jgi:hypothetical protein
MSAEKWEVTGLDRQGKCFVIIGEVNSVFCIFFVRVVGVDEL